MVSGIARSRAANTGTIEAYVQVAPGESIILQTSNHVVDGGYFPYYRVLAPSRVVDGSWTIRFDGGGPALPGDLVSEEPRLWTEIGNADAMRFSGTTSYHASFPMPGGDADGYLLDLGRVYESADVLLNGALLRTLIGPTYRLFLPRETLIAVNELEIRVSNLMANRISDLDRRGVLWKRFYNVNFPARLRENRSELGLFDASKWTPKPSGLLGPVTLTPVEVMDAPR